MISYRRTRHWFRCSRLCCLPPLRGNKLSKRVWNSYQEIVAACKDAWLFLLSDPKRIDTIAHRAWSWVNV